MVEQHLDMVEVVGSNPIPRTTFNKKTVSKEAVFFILFIEYQKNYNVFSYLQIPLIY